MDAPPEPELVPPGADAPPVAAAPVELQPVCVVPAAEFPASFPVPLSESVLHAPIELRAPNAKATASERTFSNPFHWKTRDFIEHRLAEAAILADVQREYPPCPTSANAAPRSKPSRVRRLAR